MACRHLFLFGLAAAELQVRIDCADAMDAWGQRSAQGRAGGRTTGKLIV